jgi:hypothetical protein
MKAIDLINKYRDENAGKSAYIDQSLNTAEQCIKDAKKSLDRADKDFAKVNLYLARNSITRLLEAIPAPDKIRMLLVDVYSSIDTEICDVEGHS